MDEGFRQAIRTDPALISIQLVYWPAGYLQTRPRLSCCPVGCQWVRLGLGNTNGRLIIEGVSVAPDQDRPRSVPGSAAAGIWAIAVSSLRARTRPGIGMVMSADMLSRGLWHRDQWGADHGDHPAPPACCERWKQCFGQQAGPAPMAAPAVKLIAPHAQCFGGIYIAAHCRDIIDAATASSASRQP